MQLSLIQDETISKTIKTIPITDLLLSEFNPRSTRGDDHINQLAQRISRNGFEITRALWVYKNGNGYKVFAGGNRLEAAKRAGVKTIPCIVHEGATDTDLVRLAYQDNENDEYHAPVSVVDVWANYAALAGQGWTQQKIAEAVGVKQAMVSYRLKLNTLPEKVKGFISQDQISEAHLTEIMQLSVDLYFSSWLTTEAAQLELCQSAAKQKLTVRQTADTVAKLKDVISYATKCYETLTGYQSEFVAELATTTARTQAAVNAAYTKMVKRLEADARAREMELAKQQSQAEADRLRLVQEREKQAAIEAVLSRIKNGDSVKLSKDLPDNIKLVLTDPPYGQNFQSNRRVVSAKAEKLASDNGDAFELLADVLGNLIWKMADDSIAFIFSAQKYEPEFRKIVIDSGLTYKCTYIWNKPNHGSGDLDGTFSPKHECIIHAVKGNPKLNFRPDSVLNGSEFLGTTHPTEKPLDLLDIMINVSTKAGDIVVDPFFGSGSTLVSAIRNNRTAYGIELDNGFFETAREVIYGLISG